MIDIDQIHVNESLRIIREYDEVKKELEIYTDYINNIKESIIKMKDKIDLLMKDKSPKLKKQADLYELINKHEKEILIESKKIKESLDKMEIIKADSFKLYHILKDKYPGANDKQLKDSLDLKIKEAMKNIPNLFKRA